jgi:D-2-hydroxyacid dehydrogenase (NADP+)
MNIVLLQTKLSLEEINQLLQEFPHYLFLSLSEEGCKDLDSEHWSRVEIFFGEKISSQQLAKAHQLRWIHSPGDDLGLLCMEEIRKRGNIIVSLTENPNTSQAGEFFLGGILAFAKNLFYWRDAARFPNLLWDVKWKSSMWTLENKILLIVGVDKVTEFLAKKAREFGMRIYGASERRTFHSHCDKTFALKELHSVFPSCDIVLFSLPKDKKYFHYFGDAELNLMKEDSLLIIRRNHRVLSDKKLYEVARGGKFRGIIIDTYHETPISTHSPLWQLSKCIITPEVSYLPEMAKGGAFQSFRFNLRQYLHGNFADLKGLAFRLSDMVEPV